MSQTPDTKPGAYYVTAMDGGRVARVVGPFLNDHAAALAIVDAARAKAEEVDPRAAFYAFGTCRTDAPCGPGALNRFFGLPQ